MILSDFYRDHYEPLQAWTLLAMALCMMLFGASVLAQQHRDGKRIMVWPVTGSTVGGWFLIVKGCLPLHMALVRFHLLPWTTQDWQATVIYQLIALDAVLTVSRWWRRGFVDAD